MTTYTFDNSGPETIDQFDSLETCLDPTTIRQLELLDIPKGARCWEIGAGGGSIATWLSHQVGPPGHVLASDINVDRLSHLEKLGNVSIVKHDVATLTPPDDDGPFQLIHARLVLLHLPQRRQILHTLAAALAPGGWLLIEEFDGTVPLWIYRSTSPEDAELFCRVTAAILAVLESNGADMAWAHEVHSAMADAGLTAIHTTAHAESWPGGSPGARLHATNTRQLADQLHTRGLTAADLDRFRTIVTDPTHAASSYQLVSTRGQRRPTPPVATGEATDAHG